MQYGVVSYNIVECVIALFIGRRIQSIALFGFGLDGLVEIAASVALLVHLKRNSQREGSPWEGRVARFIGITLVMLALFIFNDAMLRLTYRVKPDESVIAMALASVSLVVMLRVARAEQALAHGLNSVALRAESRETLVCAWLSAALLTGLGANLLFGLWWVDPAVGVVIGAFIAREGLDAISSRELFHDHDHEEAPGELEAHVRRILRKLGVLRVHTEP